MVDIANDPPSQWSEMKETPATVVFEKAERGPLGKDWMVFHSLNLC
jgi:hypothetical protein